MLKVSETAGVSDRASGLANFRSPRCKRQFLDPKGCMRNGFLRKVCPHFSPKSEKKKLISIEICCEVWLCNRNDTAPAEQCIVREAEKQEI